MELNKEIIDKHELSTEAVTAIQSAVVSHYDTHISDLKGEWDGAANKGAQEIVDDIIEKTQKETGFQLERNQGEKNAPFLLRYTKEYLGSKLSGEKSAMEQSKLDYDNKVKDFKGDETLKGDYDTLKITHSDLQKKEATFDELTKAGFEDKYNTLLTESDTMREDIAFGTAKPVFSKDSNEYEVKSIWNGFIKGVKETHNIVVVDGEGIAIDKSNEHKRFPLKDLVKGNEELTRLIDGRKQNGINATQTDYTDVDGVPFKVPTNATRSELAQLIQEQLTKDGVGPTHTEHSKKFQDMYDKAKAAQRTAA